MTPTQDLFQLIKSLTKAEKRYIKLSAANKNSSIPPDYIILFDAIDKQEEYNETLLKKSFSDKAFIKRLPETKYYLHEVILKNLRRYHTNSSADMRIRVLLDSADILLKKKLYEQCADVLNKAAKLARFHDRNLLLLETIETETRLLSATKNIKGLEKLIEQTDQGNLLNKHVNTLHYNILAEKYYIHQSTYFLNRNAQALKQLVAIPAQPLLRNESTAVSVWARQSFHRMFAQHYGALCDYGQAFRERLICTTLIEKLNSYTKHHLDNYKACIYMLLIYAAKTKNEKVFQHYYDRFLFTIKKLKKESDPETLAQTIYLKNHFEINMHNEVQRIKELTRSGKLDTFKKHRFASELTGVYFMESMAILYFNAENYSESLAWLHKLLNKQGPISWLNNYSVALKLCIMACYESENFDLVETYLKSAERFLTSHKICFDFDRLFITTFKKLLKAVDRKAEKQILQSFKQEALILNENTSEKLAFYYFDYIRWTDKKIRSLQR